MPPRNCCNLVCGKIDEFTLSLLASSPKAPGIGNGARVHRVVGVVDEATKGTHAVSCLCRVGVAFLSCLCCVMFVACLCRVCVLLVLCWCRVGVVLVSFCCRVGVVFVSCSCRVREPRTFDYKSIDR